MDFAGSLNREVESLKGKAEFGNVLKSQTACNPICIKPRSVYHISSLKRSCCRHDTLLRGWDSERRNEVLPPSSSASFFHCCHNQRGSTVEVAGENSARSHVFTEVRSPLASSAEIASNGNSICLPPDKFIETGMIGLILLPQQVFPHLLSGIP